MQAATAVYRYRLAYLRWQDQAVSEYPGLDFVRQVAREITLPAFAIGGIAAENLRHLLAAGMHRVALARAVTSAVNPGQAARKLLEKLDA